VRAARASRRGWRNLAAATILAALPIGLVVGGAAAATRRGASTLQWHSCDTRFRCASLPVPINYARPSEGTLKLALVELPATGSHPVGDLLLNPGGPGGSGIQFLEQTPFPAALRRSFTLVSFDPRGVGQSDPVRCVGAAGIRSFIALNPAPATPAAVSTVVAATKSFDRACAAHTSHLLLENLSSAATVQDMNSIRVALGEAKLNYLGFSYGTFFGELYAQRYPTHIRAMVLDGVVDPAQSQTTSDLQQAQGFETDLKQFFAWCPTNATCHRELPTGARASYDQLFGTLASGASLPAYLKAIYGGVQKVTIGTAEVALAGSLYSKQSWPDLAQAIQQGLGGDGTLLAAIAYQYEGLQVNGTFDNELAAEVATSCLDRPSPTKVSTYEKLSDVMAKAAPDFGASEAWGTLTCAYWPVRPQLTPHAVRAPASPPILLVGSTADPATPYRWAKAVAGQLAHARLLTRVGPGHTAYFYSTCIQAKVNRYLETLRLPPPHTVCPTN
jgi:pimeloyl-ACP methyl ester carboxylesterase